MQALYDLKDMLCKELEEYSNGDLSAGKLDIIDKLAHAVKSLETIIAMNEASDTSGRYDESGRYESGRYRYSNARGRRMYSRRGGYSYNDGEKEEKIEMLRDMMQEVSSDEERRALQKIIRRYEQE